MIDHPNVLRFWTESEDVLFNEDQQANKDQQAPQKVTIVIETDVELHPLSERIDSVVIEEMRTATQNYVTKTGKRHTHVRFVPPKI